MAYASFQLKTPTNASTGSFLQQAPSAFSGAGLDDSSPLKGDGYTIPPNEAGRGFFAVIPSDYNATKLSWGVSIALATGLTGTPQPSEVRIVYSALGQPQTVAEGDTILTTKSNDVSLYYHEGVPSGKWAYYSMFIKYESVATRSWYEKVASTEVLVPTNYGSRNLLYSRIPMHYRFDDESLGLLNYATGLDGNLPDDLKDKGPLYRMLDVIGWDMDYLRTTTAYLMEKNDPSIANTEALDELTFQLGIPVNATEIGGARARNLLSLYKYQSQIKGRVRGVEEFITALTGCDTEIVPVNPNYLTSVHLSYGTVSTANSPSTLAPATEKWRLERPSSQPISATAVTTPPSTTGWNTSTLQNYTGVSLTASSVSGASVSQINIACLKAELLNVSQASSILVEYSAQSLTAGQGASVIGFMVSDTTQSASVVNYINSASVIGPAGFITNIRYPSTEMKTNVQLNMGIVGDGSLTTGTKFFHMFIAYDTMKPVDLFLRVQNVSAMDKYPYNIKVYSNRVNLCRDPRFAGGIVGTAASVNTASFWRASGASLTFPLPEVVQYEEAAISVFYDVSVTANIKRYQTVGTTSSASAVAVQLTDLVRQSSVYKHVPIMRGVDYYFSIDDVNNRITSVELYNNEIGVSMVTSSSPVRTESALRGTRKWWKLRVPDTSYYEWPRGINNCSLIINASINSTTPLTVADAVFEPKVIGDFFDGNSVNGGWLAGGSGGSYGTHDYRWGANGANADFSYYSPDYMRSRRLVENNIAYAVPTTEQAYIAASSYAKLIFNSIPGV